MGGERQKAQEDEKEEGKNAPLCEKENQIGPFLMTP